MWKQYSYIEHRIQGLQDFVSYLFLEVLFHAPEHPDEDLMAVVDETTKKLLDEVRKCKFYEQLNELYEEFKALDEDKICCLRTAFSNNNQIERLCRKKVKPFRFKDLQNAYKGDGDWKAFLVSLKSFCNDFYTAHINLKAFQDRYGTMNDYYKALIRNESVCHGCGIGNVLTEDNSPRDAFDHYLPKAIYPFVSLNFHNLVPVCPHCNSAYKREADTLFEKKGKNERQVKAFLPFKGEADSLYQIEVDVELVTCYKKENTKVDDIVVTCRCSGYEEEVQTWQRIYKIEERYRAYCHRDETICLVNDMIDQNIIIPGNAKTEMQKMERLANINGNFLVASFAKAVFRSLGITI